MTRFTRSVPLLLVLSVLAAAAPPVTAGDTETVHGQGVGSAELVSLAQLIGDPDRYVGRAIRVEGKIDDVCPRAGCWIDIADEEGHRIRFKVNDGEIVFDVADRGREVVAEGTLRRMELTQEQAVAREQHLADEKGETFDPATITGPVTYYQIQGTGAVVR